MDAEVESASRAAADVADEATSMLAMKRPTIHRPVSNATKQYVSVQKTGDRKR
jgi:hypothetical protein